MLVNGQAARRIPGTDRGLAYGDGVFETIRVTGTTPVLFDAHMARLSRGCERLHISATGLASAVRNDLAVLAKAHHGDAVFKVIVTRGEGARGYKPSAGGIPTRIASLAPYSPDAIAARDGIQLWACSTALAIDPALAGIKHLNRLPQVLAAAEIPDGYHEGIMRDTRGNIVEGTRSNVFAVLEGDLVTPPLEECGVAGTLRAFLNDRLPVVIRPLTLAQLASASEVFMCNSVFGIYPVRALMGGQMSLSWPVGKTAVELQAKLIEETGLVSG